MVKKAKMPSSLFVEMMLQCRAAISLVSSCSAFFVTSTYWAACLK